MQLSSSMRYGVATISLVLMAARTALAQDPKAIIQKANAVYTNAKTYQAILEMNISMGAMGSLTQIVDLKMLPNQKANITTKSSGKPTGQMAMAGQMNTQMVDDGKFAYTYMPAMKKYSKQPHRAGNNGNGLSMMLPTLSNPKLDKGSYKLLPPTMINGKTAYAIEISAPTGARGGSVVVYLDKSTCHVLQVKMTGGMQGQSMSMNMIVKNEKFNQPIAASVFTFTPPKGATEMQGMGGMMGGGTGMPGR